MKTSNVFLLCLLLQNINTFAQKVEVYRCSIKPHDFSKIFTLSDTSYMLIATKTGTHYDNTPYLFNSSWKKTGEKKSFGNYNRIDGSYLINLNNTLYSCETDESDTRQFTKFYIDQKINADGTHEDTSMILLKNNSRSFGKTNKENPSYEVLPGINMEKYLITYNNDYTENFPEGFRYKILTSSNQQPDTGTIVLPYNDRECNYVKTVFDDKEDVIYMLCEVFRVTDKKHRVTDHFSVFRYDLSSHNLAEGKASFMPDSSNCQMAVTSGNIYLLNFQSPDIISENDSLILYRFDKTSLELQSVHVNHFGAEFVNMVNRADKKYSFRYFEPASFVAMNDTSLASVYEYRFDEKQFNAGSIPSAVMAGILFGALGAAIMYSAMNSQGPMEYTADLLLMNIDSSGKLYPNLIRKIAMQRDPLHNSFFSFMTGVNLHLLYNNKPNLKDWYSSAVTDACFNSMTKEISFDSTSFAEQKVFAIEPGSAFMDKSGAYLTGKVDFDPGFNKEAKPRYCIIRYKID